MNPKVDFFFDKDSKWQKEFALLRRLILECGLTEEFKWGNPCYTIDGRNIVLIHCFKEYCAVLFFKGALLQNADGILIQQSENVQGARQVRFTKASEITKIKNKLKAFIFEAIEVEKSGIKVNLKKTKDYEVCEELQQKFKEFPLLKEAFGALTPGRQRGYLLYFAAPKQPKTRIARIEKSLDAIFSGKGLND